MPGHPGDPPPSYLAKSLANPAVPQAFKDLHLDILPAKSAAALKKLVDDGRIHPLDDCAACPAFSPVNQILGMNDKDARKEFLKTLFSQAPEKIIAAQCTLFRENYGIIRPLDFSEKALREKFSSGLVDYLNRYLSLTPAEILDISPYALMAKFDDGKTFAARVIQEGKLDAAFLEKLCAAANGTGFLDARNDRGETIVNILLSTPCDERTRLDALTWVLMKKPHLVNVQDNLGWTPLDRHVAVLSAATVDNATTRLLVSCGASFNRQLAPGFNLAAEVKERQSLTLDKPAPAQRKPPGLGGGK